MNITISTLTEYTNDTAAQLGQLYTELTTSADGSPVNKELLEEIISSPSHEQILAISDTGQIIGAATMSLVLAGYAGRVAVLQDFVVASESRGQGIAGQLWQAICQWATEKNANKMQFTSKPSRHAAHNFYLKHGARIIDTNTFMVTRETLDRY